MFVMSSIRSSLLDSNTFAIQSLANATMAQIYLVVLLKHCWLSEKIPELNVRD